MRLEMAIDILTLLKGEATDDRQCKALSLAIVELKEHVERIHAEADEVVPMIVEILPGDDRARRLAVWRRLRPMLRLSAPVLDEVARRLGLG